MQLIKRITDSEFIEESQVLIDNVSRYAARGVLIDKDQNVAMMFMANEGLYKLPGGGIEDHEEKEVAFLREIMEETGWDAEIMRELGIVEEHKNRNDFMQYSYCFLARALANKASVSLTESEKESDMSVVWMPLAQAMVIINESLHNCDDYSTKFMLLRDKTILQTASGILKHGLLNGGFTIDGWRAKGVVNPSVCNPF